MQAIFRALLPVRHPLIAFLGNHYDVMRAYDPGWAHYVTHFPDLQALKGVFHLQWLSLKLMKYFIQHNRLMAFVPSPDPNKIMEFIQKQRQ